MKDLLLGAMAASIVVAAFLMGRLQAQSSPPAQGPVVQAVSGGAPSASYDAGASTVISVYNPDGRLLKHFEARGVIEKTAAGELVFDTNDGRRVHTNAIYILESRGAGAATTSR